MSTEIIRYSNTSTFSIKNSFIDFYTEDINIVDYTNVDENHIYYIGGSRNRNEFVTKEIGSNDWKRALIDLDFYSIDNLDELIKTGHTTASHYNNYIDVYAGLHAKKALEEIGEKSLLECYKCIEERRNEHKKNLDEINLLRLTAKNLHINKNTNENIVDDIKWFLDNRKEIKEKCSKK